MQMLVGEGTRAKDVQCSQVDFLTAIAVQGFEHDACVRRAIAEPFEHFLYFGARLHLTTGGSRIPEIRFFTANVDFDYFFLIRI